MLPIVREKPTVYKMPSAYINGLDYISRYGVIKLTFNKRPSQFVKGPVSL